MLIKRPDDIKSSEITPEDLYLNRRKFLALAGVATAGVVGSGKIASAFAAPPNQEEKPNTWEEITTYNNYYEFGTGKDEPAQNAGNFKTKPWTVNPPGRPA